MKRLERLVSIALVMATRRRLRAEELAAQFSVSTRTVYRDVHALQSAGFPVEGNAGDGYRVPTSAYLRPLALDEREAAALALAAQLLSASADESLRKQLASATAKLESVLQPDVRQHVRTQRKRFYVSPLGRRSGGPLGELLSAIDARAVLQIDYEPVTNTPKTTREIEPLGFVRIGNALLLVAYCRLRQAVRSRVDRIRRLVQTGERYATRPELSFAEVVERERQRPRN